MNERSPISPEQSRNVQFIRFEETGEWVTWNDSRISLRIPREWEVAIDAETSEDGAWKYVLKDENAGEVFWMRLVRGGPEWNDRFCIPQTSYEHTEKLPYKFWALSVDFRPNAPGGMNYCFKVASKTLRLDIKTAVPDDDPRQVMYIAQSARTIEAE